MGASIQYFTQLMLCSSFRPDSGIEILDRGPHMSSALDLSFPASDFRALICFPRWSSGLGFLSTKIIKKDTYGGLHPIFHTVDAV